MADNVQEGPTGGMRAVTISREYGSGGGEIAARLAKRLGWQLVDHEVVVRVAEILGVSEEEAEEHDEHVDDLATRILSSLSLLQVPAPGSMPVQLSMESPTYDEARRKAVAGAIAAGNAVIVGRGAQALLAGRRDVLHIRIVAPLSRRIEYVMTREGLDHEAAQARIHQKDHDRARFLARMHHLDPADAHLYDITVNTGVLDLDSAVDLLVRALEHKAKKLPAPAEALGPAANVNRYAEPPGTFGPSSEATAS